MVIVQVYGGLGNQLFQYAAGRAVAERNKTTLKLDISKFESYPKRTYGLSAFNVREEFATPQEIHRFLPEHVTWIGRIRERFMRRFVPPYQRPVFYERSLAYADLDIYKVRRNVYLNGYWQSELYFADIADIIRREFTLKEEPDEPNQRMLEQIEATNSVSLHIRRGDYVTDQAINQVHGALGPRYYDAAIDFVGKRVAEPHFFVFSDDMPWAKQNLQLPYATIYVDVNDPAKDSEDLRLLSHCKHHIIANSTFSWWGAWLSRFPQKLVVAPQRWFAQMDVDVASRYPSGWTVLS